MTPAEWIVIKQITAAALALPPVERDSFVSARCGGDESLRAHVTSLLETMLSPARLGMLRDRIRARS